MSKTATSPTVSVGGKESEGRGRSTKDGLKRYNLVIPEGVYDEVQSLSEKQHTSVIDLLRRFIKLGLLITKLMDDPDAELIIRKDGKERQLVFFT